MDHNATLSENHVGITYMTLLCRNKIINQLIAWKQPETSARRNIYDDWHYLFYFFFVFQIDALNTLYIVFLTPR